jgi:hypothetical protein
MPVSSASSATGDGCTLRPRPDWASGRVTTATTSCRGESIRVRSDGSAASGVPAKTRRIS